MSRPSSPKLSASPEQGDPHLGRPVGAAADQRAHFGTGSGEDREDESVQVPDRALLDNSLVAKAASAPGARTAVADLTFPVQRDRNPLTAHNWGSTAFTGEKLTAGRAPHPGEAVLAGTAASVGDHVTLTTPEGTRAYRVSGTTATQPHPTAWLADSEAVRVSGHPGRIDAIAVLPKSGVADGTLKAQVAHALGARADVHTGDDRGAAEDGSLAEAREPSPDSADPSAGSPPPSPRSPPPAPSPSPSASAPASSPCCAPSARRPARSAAPSPPRPSSSPRSRAPPAACPASRSPAGGSAGSRRRARSRRPSTSRSRTSRCSPPSAPPCSPRSPPVTRRPAAPRA